MPVLYCDSARNQASSNQMSNGYIGLGVVKTVVEPEAVLLVVGSFFVFGGELIVVRIHALPPLGSGDGLDLVRIQETRVSP